MFSPPQLLNLPPNHTDLVVTGDDEGIFGVDSQFLYALKPLDREKQPSYSLQVESQLPLTQFQCLPSKILSLVSFLFTSLHYSQNHVSLYCGSASELYSSLFSMPVFEKVTHFVQVSFRTPVSRQSFTVEVCVIDKNDNVPTFIRESMRGSVQLGLLKGKRTLSC